MNLFEALMQIRTNFEQHLTQDIHFLRISALTQNIAAAVYLDYLEAIINGLPSSYDEKTRAAFLEYRDLSKKISPPEVDRRLFQSVFLSSYALLESSVFEFFFLLLCDNQSLFAQKYPKASIRPTKPMGAEDSSESSNKTIRHEFHKSFKARSITDILTIWCNEVFGITPIYPAGLLEKLFLVTQIRHAMMHSNNRITEYFIREMQKRNISHRFQLGEEITISLKAEGLEYVTTLLDVFLEMYQQVFPSIPDIQVSNFDAFNGR